MSAQAMSNFLISLEIMGMGMAGIFFVIILIMLVIMGLTKFTSTKDESNE